ncbi:peptide deformylase [uncultured Alsobacter sp.]|uniref:peptide deformylase n=1 Tax=uncultured Alsobacter sp. TaxID=1748258 RepID=UPI0025F5F3CB|nr:peptide deformylase [uncultured Alsobacter sp.]
MPARPIVFYPDERLNRPAAPVERFDETLAGLVRDIGDTMIAAPAVGLTAVHIGVPLRVTMIRLDLSRPASVYVNPEVLWASQETAAHTEGSVSLPGLSEEVTRPARVRVGYLTAEGEWREDEADGFLAATLQHEIDQLDGVFWLARLSRLKRERLLKKAGKLRRADRPD